MAYVAAAHSVVPFDLAAKTALAPILLPQGAGQSGYVVLAP
jgi:hypothetical protein